MNNGTIEFGFGAYHYALELDTDGLWNLYWSTHGDPLRWACKVDDSSLADQLRNISELKSSFYKTA